jgi:peptide/nickel transport system permease protein
LAERRQELTAAALGEPCAFAEQTSSVNTLNSASAFVEAAKDHVRAAKALGASNYAIVSRHILPNILSLLIVVATTQVAGAIMAEAALSFLGLGLPITQPSLGTLIRSGYDLIFAGIWWVTVLPGLTLVGVLVAVNLLGDTLRDSLDPRLAPS